MRGTRGYTLIELMVVVAIAAILSVAAFATVRAALRNASLSGGSHELVMQLQGQRAAAMAEGADRVVVVVDALGDGTACGLTNLAACLNVYVVRPGAGWTLGAFEPADPHEGAEPIDAFRFDRGIRLAGADWTPPPPFDAIAPFDGDLVALRGGRRCFAIRFAATGEVRPEFASGTPALKPGFSFVIGSDLVGQSTAADRHGILVSFPTGIVRSAAFRPGMG